MKVPRRRRRAGEYTTRGQAIKNHCCQCMGWQLAEVKRCTSPKCWLFPFRNGRKQADTADTFPGDPADSPGDEE